MCIPPLDHVALDHFCGLALGANFCTYLRWLSRRGKLALPPEPNLHLCSLDLERSLPLCSMGKERHSAFVRDVNALGMHFANLVAA